MNDYITDLTHLDYRNARTIEGDSYFTRLSPFFIFDKKQNSEMLNLTVQLFIVVK